MRINPTTLMFEDLSPEEALELFTQLDNIVTHGRIEYENPLLKEWFAVAPFNELHNKLMGASVVLPAKLGLSLTRYYYNPMLLRKSRI
jgi:hypothetical protein